MKRQRKRAGWHDASPVRKLSKSFQAEGMDELSARRLAAKVASLAAFNRLQKCVFVFRETGMALNVAERALQNGGQ